MSIKNPIGKVISQIQLKRIMKIIGNIAFAIVLVVFGCVVLFSILNKVANSNPTIADHQIYDVLGGSMEPTIHKGSIVLVKHIDSANLAVKNVITFKDSNNEIVSHRIVAINGSGKTLSFTTRGDANNANDNNPVPAENVIGKVGVSIPYVGYIINFTQTKAGLLVLIIIPGVLIIVLETLNLFKQIILLDRKKQAQIHTEMNERSDSAFEKRGDAIL
jgi:signal peptidase